MTYNFDLDRWWDREYLLLEQRRVRGDLDARDFDEAVRDLEQRLERLTRNLDGSYQVASSGTPGSG